MSRSPASMPAHTRLALWRTAALVYLLALAWLVLTPAAVAGQATGIVSVFAHALETLGIPFRVGYPVLEFTANIVLFAPFGALAVFAVPVRSPAGASTFIVIAAGCLTSAAIEVTQLFAPGRVSTISDVIANTLGTAAGAALAWWVLRLIRRGALAGAASARPAPPGGRRRDTPPPSA